MASILLSRKACKFFAVESFLLALARIRVFGDETVAMIIMKLLPNSVLDILPVTDRKSVV